MEKERLANEICKGCIRAGVEQLREDVRRLVMMRIEAGIATPYDDLGSLDPATKAQVQVEREYHERLWRIVRMIEGERSKVGDDTRAAAAEFIKVNKRDRTPEQ